MAVASIWMSAALPSWRQQVTREKEAELIFRGEQYARAIFLYSQKMNGAMPSSFDDLLSQHTLRHKWKDPITGDEFLPKVGCQASVGGPTVGVPGGGLPAVGPGRGSAGPTGGPTLLVPPSGGAGSRFAPTAGQAPAAPGLPARTPAGQSPSPLGQAGQQGLGGICGVQSKSKAASIKIYNGQQEYDLWQFDILMARVQFQQNVTRLGGGTGAGQGIALPINSPRGGRGNLPPLPGGRGPAGPGGRFPGPGTFPGPGGSPEPGGRIGPGTGPGGGGRTGR
jgi:hypothetical protein